MQLRRQATALDLARRLAHQSRFLRPVQTQHGGDPAAVTAQMCTQRDVVEHTAVAQQAHMLEGACQTDCGENT